MPRLSKITAWLLLAILAGCAGETTGDMAQKDPSMSKKQPAIVLVAFGTTSDKGREVFNLIEQAAQKRYPEHDIFLAFTSQTVIGRLRGRGVMVRDLPETLTELEKQGYQQAVLQSLMIVPGQKDAEITQIPTGRLQVAYGRPLMASADDIRETVDAIRKNIATDRPTVFVTHGNGKYPQYNRALLDFAAAVEGRFTDTVTCSVEGEPGLAKLDIARKRAREAGAVHFVPLMLVAGDHIENDVLGDEPDSWKNLVDAPGASCDLPLGYNPAILDIFFRHLDAAMATLQGEKQ